MKTTRTIDTLCQSLHLKGIGAVLAGLLLVACDSVPTESTPNVGTTNRVLAYSGPSCSTTDACTFKVEFWNKMSDKQCTNCHDSQGNTTQSPFFMESSDVNIAYTQTKTIVNLPALRPATADPTAPQEIVEKIREGHNCGNTGACNALADIVLGYITNWANGGTVGSGGTTNVVVLTAPAIRNTGDSKSFPSDSAGFETTVWPLLRDNCANCHTESASTPQSPFFAESDVNAAYAAVVSSQKINLDDPAISRLVVRLDPEFHNCWATPTGADPTGCITSGQLMLEKIIEFAGSILPTAVDDTWVTSKALDLTDGILASGGARDDSSTIALYEMKSGSGNTLYDTSGVEPALDLNLSGNADIDFKWVGGWGVEFISGRAQGSAQNTKLRDQIVSSGEYSIEAWVVPANVNQGEAGDPSRIITYSAGHTTRNFTLGQAEYRYEYMNRNENSDANGQASFITDDADEDLQASQQHVVVTYDPINGRRIYVNGLDVSGIDIFGVDNPNDNSGEVDPVAPGSITNWDDSFAFILGSEAGGDHQWAGKLRLVAIHNRAMTPAQVTQNFDAGVGEKFFLMFSVSDLMDTPALPPSDSNCFQISAVTARNPRGDQCFIYMLVSQFDSYSYLFNTPTFISLNSGFDPDIANADIVGMRIGLNGKEPAVGQAFVNVGKPTPVNINVAAYDAANGGQVVSSIGTIIALEKGAGADEFFLSFEQFGSNTDEGAHADAEYVCDVANISTCLTSPVIGTRTSDIGLRTFDEINATMAELTGVDRNTTDVKVTFDTIRQQLPPVETIEGFVSANQMAIAQLAIQYCDALVESTGLNIGLRDSFFNGFVGFNSPVATAFASSTEKDQIVDALYNKMVGYPDPNSTPIVGVTLTNVPSKADVKAELIGPVGTNPNNLFDKLGIVMTNVCNDPDPLINVNCDNSDIRTRAVTKALCTSVLGSAIMLIQ